MKLNNKYGYKVCYREYGKNKLKLYVVTNTFGLAESSVRWCEQKPPSKLHKPEWEIFEVKTLQEYEKLWKGCPFKDTFSD